ncbi:MAG: InlB B-repeat-containing protein, partial [Clostridia bacterium]
MFKYQRKNKSDKHNTRKFNIGLLAILLIVALTSVTLFGCGTSVTVTVVGGTGSGEYAVGAEITITATVPEGKTFVEWQVDGNKVSDKAIYTFPVAGAITITAIFSGNPKSYTVAFNSNNGSAVDSQIVTEGEKAAKPNDPLRLGYAFGGWFTDNESFLLEYKFQEAVNADAQLYAKWTVKQYAIAYSGLDGAQLDGKPLVHTYGADTIVGNPTKTGFAFDGWSVNGSSDKVSNLVLGATAYTNDINLTANWVVNAYTITYRGLEKAELLVKPLSHTGGTATPVGNPTKVGYTFEGWFVNESRDKIKDLVLGATDYTDNITLFAIWTPNKYAITYVLDGGIAGANAPTTHTYGAITGLVSPTKEGYTFVGWNDGGNIVSSILDAKAYTADITLTAVYTLNTPTATLTADRNNIAYDGKDFTLTASAT